MLDFAQELIQTEYAIELDDKEEITAVILVDAAGEERSLSMSDFSFDFEAQIFSVDPSAIASADADMRVESTKHCETVIR